MRFSDIARKFDITQNDSFRTDKYFDRYYDAISMERVSIVKTVYNYYIRTLIQFVSKFIY